MKSVFAINSCNFGSTGNIMLQIAQAAREDGYHAVTCCPQSRSNRRKQMENQIFIGNRFSRNIHIFLGRQTGFHGCFSILSTFFFIRKLEKEQPDIIHLHNLHSDYINLPILFRYIKKHNVKVVWTLHDCWAFTGQCPYFTIAKCDKWITGCHDCPSYQEYPASRVDRTKTMWELKKKWFTGVKNMTIVTPSQWMADLVKQSFLQEYSVRVIHNGIDLSVFKPMPSDFRQRHKIPEDKFLLLGVAFGWGKRKGLDVFVELSKRLDSEKYQIVLVGTDDMVDKQLPENVISIHRTQNQTEMAEIYTAADLFVNPTREENYPTVNMEAIACGTPVLTFRTGGSPEIVDECTGVVVDCDDVDAMEREILFISQERPFAAEACTERAKQFSKEKRFTEYLELYQTLTL